MKFPAFLDEMEHRKYSSIQKGKIMAKLATKPHLIASLNVMLATRQKRGEETFTQDEIIEILSAMAESDAISSGPPSPQNVHWQTAPSRII